MHKDDKYYRDMFKDDPNITSIDDNLGIASIDSNLGIQSTPEASQEHPLKGFVSHEPIHINSGITGIRPLTKPYRGANPSEVVARWQKKVLDGIYSYKGASDIQRDMNEYEELELLNKLGYDCDMISDIVELQHKTNK